MSNIKYRKISTRIWDDSKFVDLSRDAKLLFILMLTHPHTTAIGTLREYPESLGKDIGMVTETLSKGFQELLEKGMIRVSERGNLIWLPNFLKHNKPENPNVLKSWVGSINECPECALKDEIIQNVIQFVETLPETFQKGFSEAFGKPFQKGMPKQEQEQEQEQEEEGEKKQPAISPPTISELPSKCPSCPHGEIVNLFQEIIPELPSVKILTKKRKDLISSRWLECWNNEKYGTLEEGLTYWKKFFEYVHNDCPFVTGKKPGRDGKLFKNATFDWLLEEEHFVGIVEERYADSEGTDGR